MGLAGNDNSDMIQTEELIDIIDAVTVLLPTDSFISIDKYMVPLKDKFLRETVKEVNFKYSGEISLIGKIVSPYKKPTTLSAESPNMLQFSKTINSISLSLLSEIGLGGARFIVSPIALYF